MMRLIFEENKTSNNGEVWSLMGFSWDVGSYFLTHNCYWWRTNHRSKHPNRNNQINC